MSRHFGIKKSEKKHFTPLAMCGPVTETTAIGKTIKSFHREHSQLFVKFTDDSFIILQSDECDCGESSRLHVTESLSQTMPQTLLRAGVISKDQFDAWAEESTAKHKAKSEERERKEFERLKKKFESAQGVPGEVNNLPLFPVEAGQ